MLLVFRHKRFDFGQFPDLMAKGFGVRKKCNRSRVGVLMFWFLRQETGLDLNWQIGNDIGHVVTKVLQPTGHSA